MLPDLAGAVAIWKARTTTAHAPSNRTLCRGVSSLFTHPVFEQDTLLLLLYEHSRLHTRMEEIILGYMGFFGARTQSRSNYCVLLPASQLDCVFCFRPPIYLIFMVVLVETLSSKSVVAPQKCESEQGRVRKGYCLITIFVVAPCIHDNTLPHTLCRTGLHGPPKFLDAFWS